MTVLLSADAVLWCELRSVCVCWSASVAAWWWAEFMCSLFQREMETLELLCCWIDMDVFYAFGVHSVPGLYWETK